MDNIYEEFKDLIGFKCSLEKFSIISQSQFNHHTLPVSPFQKTLKNVSNSVNGLMKLKCKKRHINFRKIAAGLKFHF